MTMNHDITIIRNCTTSTQLFPVVETFAYQVSELEDRLKRAEYAYDWDAIESALGQLAVSVMFINLRTMLPLRWKKMSMSV